MGTSGKPTRRRKGTLLPALDAIERQRYRRDMMQKEAAARMGITERRWRGILECAHGTPTPETIARMAESVGLVALDMQTIAPDVADVMRERARNIDQRYGDDRRSPLDLIKTLAQLQKTWGLEMVRDAFEALASVERDRSVGTEPQTLGRVDL